MKHRVKAAMEMLEMKSTRFAKYLCLKKQGWQWLPTNKYLPLLRMSTSRRVRRSAAPRASTISILAVHPGLKIVVKQWKNYRLSEASRLDIRWPKLWELEEMRDRISFWWKVLMQTGIIQHPRKFPKLWSSAHTKIILSTNHSQKYSHQSVNNFNRNLSPKYYRNNKLSKAITNCDQLSSSNRCLVNSKFFLWG